MFQALPKYSYAWLSVSKVRKTQTALTSDNSAKRLSSVDMAARACWKLARAINAKQNGLNPDPPNEEIEFSMQYTLEVDLEYNRKIYDFDDDFPLALELMQIKTNMLSSKHF